MKPRIRNVLFLPTLIVSLGLLPSRRATAQTFTTLHDFANSDGASPSADLILSGGTLYGTTEDGGSWGNGTLFRLHTNGTGFTNLHSFTACSGPGGINNDGAHPFAGLMFVDNVLFGATYYGGSSGRGTIFKVNTNGSDFQVLRHFPGGSEGFYPSCRLVFLGNTLYGTAYGGDVGAGAIFAINTNGNSYTNLYSFTGHNDGGNPSSLTLSGNAFYGTTQGGGSSGYGAVFRVNVNGTGFTNLYEFTGEADGAYPDAKVIPSGNALFGTASEGGDSGYGTVFRVNMDGTGFTNLHSFNSTNGANPYSKLILSGNSLYGTTFSGGSFGRGTVFAVNIDGTGFTNLHSFNGGSDGSYVLGGLVSSGNSLFGVAIDDGEFGYGTVFSLSLPTPRLAIVRSGPDVILTWRTPALGVTLQCTTNLVPPVIWTVVYPDPVLVNGQNTVTNPISGTQQFYRLSQ